MEPTTPAVRLPGAACTVAAAAAGVEGTNDAASALPAAEPPVDGAGRLSFEIAPAPRLMLGLAPPPRGPVVWPPPVAAERCVGAASPGVALACGACAPPAKVSQSEDGAIVAGGGVVEVLVLR